MVIAKPIRDSLGLAPGWISIQRLVDDHVELYFLPPDHRESLRPGFLRGAQEAPYMEGPDPSGRRFTGAGGAGVRGWSDARTPLGTVSAYLGRRWSIT